MFSLLATPMYRRIALIFMGVTIAYNAYMMPATASTYQVMLNGLNLALSQAPIMRGGRLFVPMRSIFQGLNAGVAYYNGTINATAGDNTVQVKVGSNEAVVDGRQTFLDAAPFIIGSTAMVPLRFVSEALGATVNYDSQAGTIAIAAAKPLIPTGSVINATLETALDTGSAYIGEPVKLNVSGQNNPAGLDGATILGKVVEVQAAAQGTNPSIQIGVDTIAPPASTDPLPIDAKVLKVDPVSGSVIAKEAEGTLAGMLVGNYVGKHMESNQGGLIGAVGGYLYASNSKANFSVPSGTPVSLELNNALQMP
ncbi:MAG TPA: stalk domain-containing protein [Candidatus Eremiobacteraceae bacterium]|nr:stalk domain-containing protein [Candidatus Eremiobacteraceae bacterium]